MKKSFPLEIQGKQTPRVIDSIKHEVRKYLKRERRKKLPDGVDYWDFDCRVGATSEHAETTHVAAISEAIDTVTQENPSVIYIEILAKPGRRRRKSRLPKQDNPNTDKNQAPVTKT